ncbi:MAG: ABC transporter permease [Anaerolineales bacterium]
MRHWFAVFRFEFFRQIQRKGYLLMTFGVPVVALVVLGVYTLATSGDGDDEDEAGPQDVSEEFEDAQTIGLVDRSGVFGPPAEDSPFAPLITFYEDVESSQSALQDGEIDHLFVVQPDYMETGAVTEFMRNFSLDFQQRDLIETYLLVSLAGDVSPETLMRLRAPTVNIDAQRVTDGGEAEETTEAGSFLGIYAFALVMMLAIFSSSGYLMQSVVEEKESQIVEIILSSVRPFPLLVGKVAAMGITGLFQIGLWLAVALFIFNNLLGDVIDIGELAIAPETIAIGFVYFLLGFGFVGGVFAAVGALTNNMREGSQLSGWLVLPIIIPLTLIAVFVEDPDGTVPVILSIIPFTAPLAMVMRSVIGTVTVVELALSLTLMVILVFASLWLAGRIFRVGNLLRGNMPKLRELPALFLRG